MRAPTKLPQDVIRSLESFALVILGETVMGAQRIGKVTVCSELRRLGFASGRRARLYGEEFAFVSDPEADENGYCLKAVSHKSGHARRVHIPLSVVRTVERELLVEEKIEIARAA
jgi:hypothetical protein